jgi:hypothetical protein
VTRDMGTSTHGQHAVYRRLHNARSSAHCGLITVYSKSIPYLFTSKLVWELFSWLFPYHMISFLFVPFQLVHVGVLELPSPPKWMRRTVHVHTSEKCCRNEVRKTELDSVVCFLVTVLASQLARGCPFRPADCCTSGFRVLATETLPSLRCSSMNYELQNTSDPCSTQLCGKVIDITR